MGRKIAGTILGLVAAFITIMIAQATTLVVVTPPTPEMMQNPEAMRAWIANIPATAYITLAIGYAIGSFVGGFVAAKISGGSAIGFIPSMVVGVFLLLAGIVNFFVTMPGSPMWAIILCLLIYIPFAFLGNRTAGSGTAIVNA